MAGKVGEKKKQLKTLVTFHSEAVFNRAQDEQNTSALVEALLARHFGIDIDGDTVQAQLRRAVLDTGGLNVPISNRPITPSPEAVDEFDETDGDLDDVSGDVPTDVLTAVATEIGTANSGVAQSKSVPEPELIPDRPVAPATPEPAFEPVAQPTVSGPDPESVSEPVVEPSPTPKPSTLYPLGARVCPTCGDNMGTDPYCLTCL